MPSQPNPLDDPFDFAKWYEQVAFRNPAGASVFGIGATQIPVRGFVPFEDAVAFVKTVLGYSMPQGTDDEWEDPAGGDAVPAVRLRRQLPVVHPRFPYAMATGLSMEEFCPHVESVSGGSGADPSLTVKRPRDADLEPGPAYAAYRKYLATISFTTVGFDILSDTYLEDTGLEYDEFLRFVHVENRGGSYQVLSSGTQTLKFGAGPAGPQPDRAAYDFVGGAAATVTSVNYDVIWDWSNYAFVCDEDNAVLLNKALGKVNASAWRGWPAGTAKIEGYSIEKRTLPVVTDGPRDAYACRVTLQISFCDPPLMNLSAYENGAGWLAGEEWRRRGHNTVPYIEAAAEGGSGGATQARKLFVPASSTGTPAGAVNWPSVEFNDIFKSHAYPIEIKH